MNTQPPLPAATPMPAINESIQAGLRQYREGQYSQAEQLFSSVLQQDPDNAFALNMLGLIAFHAGRLDDAEKRYIQAIQVQPVFSAAYSNLGNVYEKKGQFDKALSAFDQALRQNPENTSAMRNKGNALYWSGAFDQALDCFKQVLEHVPDDPEALTYIGIIHLLKGNFAAGWPAYRNRWNLEKMVLPDFKQPAWNGEPLDGKTIVLLSEQGFGDTVHYIRYGAVLKSHYDCRVIAVCPLAMIDLLSGCAGIDQVIAPGTDLPPYDVYSTFLDVPAILGETLETTPGPVPYLVAGPGLCKTWQKRLSVYGGFKIGIVWQGNPNYCADLRRSFALTDLEPLGRLTGVHLFSLQKHHGRDQLNDLCARMDIVNLGDRIDQHTGAFVETAAVLKNLDLVVAPDTAVAHVAGALGVPLWVALSNVPFWPWQLDREDTPWYPSARLFRLQDNEPWRAVFQRMADRLTAEIPGIQPRTPADYRLADCGMNRVVRSRHGLLGYNRHDLYVGRSLELYGEYSEAEIDLFRQLVKPGQTIVEAGANIGAHTLALAKMTGPGGSIFAFEPQRILFQLLCGNLAMNGILNVICNNQALTTHPGVLTVPQLDYRQPNNFGGVDLDQGRPSGETVTAVPLDSLSLSACHLLKVDVEGMELDVLQGAQNTLVRNRPLLYIENDRADKSPALIRHLFSLDYNLYWHLPPLFNRANYFQNPENVFPGIVSINMLGIHKSVNADLTGFRQIQSPDSTWKE